MLKLNLPHLQGQKQEREAMQDKNMLCIISYMHRLFVGYSLCVKELLLYYYYIDRCRLFYCQSESESEIENIEFQNRRDLFM